MTWVAVPVGRRYGVVGSGVEFSNSFGASGDQSRAVEAGQPADVVHFSLSPDMTRLVDSGQVSADWQKTGAGADYDGYVEDSVVVFVVRKGNPDDIQSWDDLIQPGTEVLTPNPFTSGGAHNASGSGATVQSIVVTLGGGANSFTLDGHGNTLAPLSATDGGASIATIATRSSSSTSSA